MSTHIPSDKQTSSKETDQNTTEAASFTPDALDDIFKGLDDKVESPSQCEENSSCSHKVNIDHLIDEDVDDSEVSAPDIHTESTAFNHRDRLYVISLSVLLIIIVVLSIMMLQRNKKSTEISNPGIINSQVPIKQNKALQKGATKTIPDETQAGLNTPPTIYGAEMIPVILKTGTAMEIHASASDADGDKVQFSYEWLLNGQFESNEPRLTKPFKRGDSISVTISPYDGVDYGKPLELTRDIQNTPPQIIGGKSILSGSKYSYQLETVDNDNDTLTYALSSAPKGMIIDSSGLISWTVPAEYKGSVNLTVTIKDGNGGKASQQLTLSISDVQT